MAGKIKQMIDQIVKEHSKGNLAIAEMTIAKLILKGINPNKFDDNSPDDIVIIEKIGNVAKQLNVKCYDNKGVNIKNTYSPQLEEVVVDLTSN